MNEIQNKLFAWMKLSIHKRKYEGELIAQEEWSRLLNSFYEQGLGSEFFEMADAYSKQYQIDQALLLSYGRMTIFSAVSQIAMLKQLQEILDYFKAQGISAIVLKGPAIARFYNKIEYRPMSDLDIFVKEDQLQYAISKIKEFGYDEIPDSDEHPVHTSFSKNGWIHIELHKALLNPLFIGNRNTSAWYKHIWSNAQIINHEQFEFCAMSTEDEIINQILHIATHLVYGSVKLRQLYDVGLIINLYKQKIDWKYIQNILIDLRLNNFGGLVFKICHILFSIDIGQDLIGNNRINIYDFIDTFFDVKNKDQAAKDKKGWRVISWKYPVLCKKMYMLPVVYIIEGYFQLKINKWKLGQALEKSLKNTKEFYQKAKIIKALGLS